MVTRICNTGPSTTSILGFARGTVADIGIPQNPLGQVSNPNAPDQLLQMVEGPILNCNANTNWSTDDVDSPNSDYTNVVFRDRLSGEDKSGLPSAIGTNGMPTMDWCATLKNGVDYTVYGEPINKAIGTIRIDDDITTFTKFACQNQGEENSICPANAIYAAQ